MSAALVDAVIGWCSHIMRLVSLALSLVGAGTALAAAPLADGEADRSYRCGDTEFPKAALGAPLGAERGTDPPAHALRRFIRYDRRLGGDFTADRSWRILLQEPTIVLFGGAGRRGHTNSYARFELSSRGWRAIQFGDCVPEVVVPGAEVAEWYLPRGSRLRRATQRLPVLIESGTCHPSARGIERSSRRPHRTEIRLTRRSVRVLVLLEPEPPPPGDVCDGVGLVLRRTVVLPEPLRGRRLLDARTVPAWPVVRGPRPR